MAVRAWRLKDRYYRLLGSRCRSCRAEFFPPVYRCRKCGSDRIEDKEMSDEGSIMTYTRLREPPPDFEAQSPFYLAVVRLNNGAKVLTQLVDSPEESVKTGARVKATIRRVRVDGESGLITYGYKFIVVG